MSMAAAPPISLSSNPPLFASLDHTPRGRFPFTLTLTPFPKKFHISASSSSSSSSPNWDREESRWLREEQRWLREEQRWLREESRWSAERQSLLREISDLKLRLQQLERQTSASEIAALLRLPEDSTEVARIAEGGVSALPLVLESAEVKEEKIEQEKRKTLRIGSEGEEVRAMQDALQALGFYSGEEDLEYSSFSSGTERAVKTWQATLGAPEDGIMTAELLARLFTEQHTETAGSKRNKGLKKDDAIPPLKDGANGAPVASVTEISEVQQKVIKEEGFTEVEVSRQRVFLLGENRWEEPSRLIGRDQKGGGNKPKDVKTKCLACRGEGRLMCTECDGTGEPNIEPQFLEWLDGGAKCAYCEGLGYTICDTCEGKP